MVARNRKAVLLNDTTVDRHHGCTTVMESIRTLAAAAGIDVVAAAPAHADWRENPAVLSAIDSAELVIVNGEGTIHHDRPAGGQLLAAGRYALSRGKAAALINATWDGNGAEFCEMARSFKIISVRETASRSALAHAGIDSRVVPDLAMLHQPPSAGTRSGVAYTDSVIGSDAIEIYRQMRSMRALPISMLFGRKSPRDLAVSVRRFMQRRSKLDAGAWSDALRGAGIDWTSQVSVRDEFSRFVASRSCVVTGRFHMLIFCLSSRTPFLAVESNTHKIGATLKDSGLHAWRLTTPAHISPAAVERAGKWHDDEMQALDAYVDAGRKDMSNLFADMASI